MTDDRRSGTALIAGSAAMIITMAFHPRGVTAPGDVEPVVRMLVAVHSLALASIPVVFLGAWGLSRKLATPERLAVVALVLFGFALVAVMNAAVFDGLVAPNVIRKIVSTSGATSEEWRIAFNYNFQLNQAYARVFAVASSIAILLWSLVIVRGGSLGRGLGVYGCILGPVATVAVFSGLLRPDVHGFGALVFAQAIWYIIAAAKMCRPAET
jgi:hypothetical protein